MRPIQYVISAGFATAAIASASLPALSWTVWPGVDFEWYASVGRSAAPEANQARTPAFEARQAERQEARAMPPARAVDAFPERPAPPPPAGTFPTGPATARGSDTSMAAPLLPAPAANEVSRR